MKITREINGEHVEISLTFSELQDAFNLVRHRRDVEDMEEYLWQYEDDKDGFFKQYSYDYDDAMNWLDDMADILRRNIEEHGMGWEDARGEALREFVSNNRPEKH